MDDPGYGLDGDNWQELVRHVKDRRCTPFLGAGASHPPLPLGDQLAKKWATEYNYPLPDKADLPRVAQFLSVRFRSGYKPRQLIVEEIAKAGFPDFTNPNQFHRALARLGFPLYITTNYDDFMGEALRRERRRPQRDFCRWKSKFSDQDFAGAEALPGSLGRTVDDCRFNSDQPLVYHLHGHDGELDSVLITEEDYFEFLEQLVRRSVQATKLNPLLPRSVRERIQTTSLMFLGYRLADPTFRVIFKLLVGDSPEDHLHVAVQLEPDAEGISREAAVEYLKRYFGKLNVAVFWGDVEAFVTELHRRL
jgi:hypothetical protein